MEKVREQLQVRKERAILVGAPLRGNGFKGDNLVELTALAETAGAIVVDRFIQKVTRITPGTYIGRGKGNARDRVSHFKPTSSSSTTTFAGSDPRTREDHRARS